MRMKSALLILTLLIAACNNTPATPTSVPSATPLPETATATPIPPTATTEPSLTPSPTATQQPTQTLTSTPADTDTPTPSATAPRPTAVPATAVPTATNTQARVEAPVFPSTGIGAWDPADFRKEIGELYNNTQNFSTSLRVVLDGLKESRCYTLIAYTDELLYGQRGYSDVPDAWYSAYYEYRVMVTNAFVGLSPVGVECRKGPMDGSYNAGQAALSIPVLDNILARVPQILNETAGLP